MIRFLISAVLAVSCYAAGARERTDASRYLHFFPDRQCDSTAFALAWKGYAILTGYQVLQNAGYLTIVDFKKASNVPRFFVLDVARQKLVVASITAHGIGSDPDSTAIPQRFSNREGSRMSSIGFYITGATYTNHRPADSLGLCLFGLDKGYNDSAAAREVVVHFGATERSGHVYVTDSGAARSFGCPALPLSTNTKIIHLISGGSCLFVYSPKVPGYGRASTVLNRALGAHITQQGPPPNNCSCNYRPRKQIRLFAE